MALSPQIDLAFGQIETGLAALKDAIAALPEGPPPPPVNRLPTVSLTGPSTLLVGQVGVFTATATDPDGDPIAYRWDGQASSSSATYGKAFSVPGPASVTVDVLDGKGGMAKAGHSLTILPLPDVPPPSSELPRRLLRATDLVRVGAFKVPSGIRAGGQANMGFEYGGCAIGLGPSGQSLFMVGHDWDEFVGEISIPALGGTAQIRQPLTNLGGGSIGSGSMNTGGTLVYRGSLLFTRYLFYDDAGAQTHSHFTRPLTLSAGPVVGPVRAGTLGAGFYSGYLAHIPTQWHAALGGDVLTGNSCLSIISRTSYGPAVFVMDGARMGNAVPLVYYPAAHPTLGPWGNDGVANPIFTGATRIRGVAFPEDTASILFVGTTGLGPYWYGEPNRAKDPSQTNKGDHAYPYVGYVWAYDVHELLKVKSGDVKPWDVRPYATWELPLSNVGYDQIVGCAWDPATKRLYLSKKFGDGERPTVEVLEVR